MMEEGYNRLKSLTGVNKQEFIEHLSVKLDNVKQLNMNYLKQNDIVMNWMGSRSSRMTITTNFRPAISDKPYAIQYDIYDALFEKGILKWVDRNNGKMVSHPIKVSTMVYNFKDNYTTIKFYLLDRDFPPTSKFINWTHSPWEALK
tara:strand:+ start:7028 stop:7465 length:438 start_codon:yes stop_codon:yes gene_type:complete